METWAGAYQRTADKLWPKYFELEPGSEEALAMLQQIKSAHQGGEWEFCGQSRVVRRDQERLPPIYRLHIMDGEMPDASTC